MSSTSKTSRRRFLRRIATLGTCAVASPYVIPSGVLAAPGRPGPNDRIGIGVIGAGRRSGQVVPEAANFKDVRIVAVADVNLPRAQEFAKTWNADSYQDYRRLLDRNDIDAIITATPDHWRALVCIHACQAGKDIYAEKPLSLTIREGRLIVQAVRKYGRVFQTGSQQRSMAPNRLGCELIRSGRIGKIQKVIAHNYPSPWECGLPAQPVPTGIDWDMWCGPTEPVPFHADLYAPRANPGWISFRPYSGGEMTGMGSHAFDQVQWALGMDDSGPVEIWTEGPRISPPTYTEPQTQERGDKACSQSIVAFRYANGIPVEFEEGRHNDAGAVFIGEKGKIEIFRDRIASNPTELVAEPIKSQDVHLYQSDDHMRNWLDCIKSREECAAGVEIGHRSATVCHLCNIARWTNRRLRWDPVCESFIDDAEANAYLDRQRRKPYELPSAI